MSLLDACVRQICPMRICVIRVSAVAFVRVR